MQKKLQLLLFFVMTSIWVSSQDFMDVATLRASYDFARKSDKKQKDFDRNIDLCYLDIGKKSTKFYSLYNFVRDSIMTASLNKGVSAFEIKEITKPLKKGDKFVYVQNYDIKTTNVAVKIFADYYQYSEKMELPVWEIGEKTKVILGYNCQSASTKFMGRVWNVYFSRDIPYNKGPWKLWGLPGLIVEAEDSEKIFKFTLTGFNKIAETPVILLDENQFPAKKMKKSTKKEVANYEKLFYTNLFEYMKLQSGRDILIQGNKAVQKAPIPYIPLEPWVVNIK